MLKSTGETPIAKKYCNFLLYLARIEKNIELKRENLCEIEAFEPYCAFRLLDQESKNFITFENIQQFLNEYRFFYEPDIIYSAVIFRYDANKDGTLNYPESFTFNNIY